MTVLYRFLRHVALAAVAAATIATAAPSAWAQDATDPAERQRIESIVRDYLLANPEVILQAIQALEERERAAADAQRNDAISGLLPTLTASPLTPVLGAENGDVVMIEFFDYQCGYCKRLFPGVQSVMEEDKGLTVVFVEYPILGPASLVAARAALAAQMQGKYFDFHVALMEFQGRLTDDAIFATAAHVGLDMDRLMTDMESPQVMEYLQMTRGIAEHLGVRGTPAMVVGDTFIGGYVPPEQLKNVIAMARGEG